MSTDTRSKKFTAPMMAPEELAKFKEHVKDAKKYFEFGAGGSTVLVFEETNAQIVAIDSSEKWLQCISDHMGETDRAQFVYIDIGDIDSLGRPVDNSKS